MFLIESVLMAVGVMVLLFVAAIICFLAGRLATAFADTLGIDDSEEFAKIVSVVTAALLVALTIGIHIYRLSLIER